MNTWQPIDTAPSGRTVWVVCMWTPKPTPHLATYARAQMDRTCQWRIGHSGIQVSKPTHWREVDVPGLPA